MVESGGCKDVCCPAELGKSPCFESTKCYSECPAEFKQVAVKSVLRSCHPRRPALPRILSFDPLPSTPRAVSTCALSSYTPLSSRVPHHAPA
jgi:hypothetical protein